MSKCVFPKRFLPANRHRFSSVCIIENAFFRPFPSSRKFAGVSEHGPRRRDLEKILPKLGAEKLARPPLVRHTLDYFLNVPRRESVENKVEHIFENRGRFIISDFRTLDRLSVRFFPPSPPAFRAKSRDHNFSET